VGDLLTGRRGILSAPRQEQGQERGHSQEHKRIRGEGRPGQTAQWVAQIHFPGSLNRRDAAARWHQIHFLSSWTVETLPSR
jgi:hypothetical protein